MQRRRGDQQVEIGDHVGTVRDVGGRHRPRQVEALGLVAPERAQKTALRHVLQTFFNGSAEQALSALLDESDSRLSDHELDRLAKVIDRARRSGA